MSPRYHWLGPGEMKRVDLDRAQAPEITEPSQPDPADVPQSDKVLFQCIVPGPDGLCGRKFPNRAIMARHFNASHTDLREDSDSWREFVEEVTG